MRQLYYMFPGRHALYGAWLHSEIPSPAGRENVARVLSVAAQGPTPLAAAIMTRGVTLRGFLPSVPFSTLRCAARGGGMSPRSQPPWTSAVQGSIPL